MPFISKPNLPNRAISSAIVSSLLLPSIRETLQKRGITLYESPVHPNLPAPVAHHPDLSALYLGDGELLVACETADQWDLPLIKIVKGSSHVYDKYPHDIAFDACIVGQYVIGKQDAMDPYIFTRYPHICHVKQGYAKCSIAVVSENAVITEDLGVYRKLSQLGMDVLPLSACGVLLPGYNRGFIGGACGKIGPDQLAFFGNIERHPEYITIARFCKKYGVEVVSLSNDPLMDFGSLMPLTE